jgi:hypothetical protein
MGGPGKVATVSDFLSVGFLLTGDKEKATVTTP